MIKRSIAFTQLSPNYLFPEIERRKQLFLQEHPEAILLNLGIGDTTLPLSEVIVEAIAKKGYALKDPASYTGYGPSAGEKALREALVSRFYSGRFDLDEIFISDGSKSDIGRLQLFLGSGNVVGIQDPVYPVFYDVSILSHAKKIVYLPCTPDNNFFPDLSQASSLDVLYFCSPHNPTGVAATFEQLQAIVTLAHEHGFLIIYDAAYSAFVKDREFPRTIYEIPGAEAVAIEVGSFSKLAGFTGVRLGWTIVPKALKYIDGSSILPDYTRMINTTFNGPSSLAQAAGIAALTEPGMKGIQTMIDYYLENATLIREGVQMLGAHPYGGEVSPYVWALFQGKNSWDVFEDLLYSHHIVSIPGSGFGPSGENFVRFSSFCTRNEALQFQQPT